MSIRRTFYLLLFLLMILPGESLATSIAIIPIEDLSLGRNAINYDITAYIHEELGNKDIFIIPQEDVINFMAKNRIRWVGQLNTIDIYKAREELGADLILLGTLTQKATKPAITLGLTLYLIRTDDGQNIWSNTTALSLDDMRRLLGISEPETFFDLMPIVVKNTLDGWPENLNAAMGKLPVLEIEMASLSPNKVKPGQEIQCRVKLRPLMPDEEDPTVYLKVGDQVQKIMTPEDRRYYEATWTTPETNGRYPVSLVFTWPTGRKKESFIGSYTIDDTPPRITLDLKGKRIQGTLAFKDQVVIIPRMLEREPLSHWRISIRNASGEEVRKEEGQGNLPPSFTWRGYDRQKMKVKEGFYQVVLNAWDKAQNFTTSTSEKLLFSRTPPAMILEAKNNGTEMLVDMQHEGKVPISFWRVEMRTLEGDLLKLVQGDSLPYQLNFPVPENSGDQNIELQLVMEDVLGNKSKKTLHNIFAEEKPAVVEEKPAAEIATDSWVAEF